MVRSVYEHKQVCLVCGEEFWTFGHWKICSDECRKKRRRRALTRKCLQCGKEFEPISHHKICSNECRRLRANEAVRRCQWRKKGLEAPPRSSRPTNCVVCGSPLDQSVGIPVVMCGRKFCKRVRAAEAASRCYHKKQAAKRTLDAVAVEC